MLWYIAGGSALGGMGRYLLGGLIQRQAGPGFPVGTLVINLTGSFLIGVVMRIGLESDWISPEMRIALTTGVLGGYTTFSSFSYETAALIRDGEYLRAGSYVALSAVLGVAAAIGGHAAAGAVLAARRGA
jgi:CrcB protein